MVEIPILSWRSGPKALLSIEFHWVLTFRVVHLTHLTVPTLDFCFDKREKRRLHIENLCPALNKPRSGGNT